MVKKAFKSVINRNAADARRRQEELRVVRGAADPAQINPNVRGYQSIQVRA